jgi:hypothetical protein
MEISLCILSSQSCRHLTLTTIICRSWKIHCSSSIAAETKQVAFRDASRNECLVTFICERRAADAIVAGSKSKSAKVLDCDWIQQLDLDLATSTRFGNCSFYDSAAPVHT